MELFDENFTDYPVDFPDNHSIIKVIGVGGGGCNVVTEIYRTGVQDIELMICNTDKQALDNNPVNEKIKMGTLGAGCNPEKGKQAALRSKAELERSLGEHIEMVFIAACLGGGTGTGASPVIAEMAKSKGKLVVGVVTLPFRYEGADFMDRAVKGLEELRKHVDSLLIIDNQKIYDQYGNLSMMQAYQKVNDVLVTAVKTIAEIVTKQGYINVDMNDVKWVMGESGTTTMGIGIAEGEGRAEKAVEEAFNSPLLGDCDLKTSKGVLVNIICNPENYRMDEEMQALENVKSYTGDPGKFKRGVVWDPEMGNKVRVTILATGFDPLNLPNPKDNTIILPGKNGDISTGHFRMQKTENVKPEPENGALYGDYQPTKVRTGAEKPVLCTDDDSLIEQREKEPAYMRRNKKRNPGINTTNTGGFSIISNTEGQAVIPSNRYLHQTQD